MPFWRAVFSPFYSHALFKSVKQASDSHGILSGISPGWLAAAYIVIIVTYRLPDPIRLIGFLSFLPLLAVQAAINEVNSKVTLEYELNDHFSWKNMVVIMLGGILLILCLIGIFVPE